MRIMRMSVGAIALGLTVGCSAPTVNYSMEAPTLSSPTIHEHADAEQRARLPEPRVLEVVSLHAILAYADKNSPLLGVARASLSLGEAAMAGASPRLPADPSVSIAMGPRIGANGTGVDFSLGVTQQIEISGARGLRIESAERLSDLKKMELKQSQWLVHQQVHRLFHQALVAKEQTVASEERLKFAESLVFIARRRLEAGDIAPLGVRVAEGEFSQAKQAKVAADGEYVSAQLVLAEAAGWPVNYLPIPAGTLDEPKKTPSVDVLLSLASKNNRQLSTLAASTRSSEANLVLADRNSWPKPVLGLQYNRESDPSASFGSAEADVILFGVSLPIPLWRKNIKSRAKARARVDIEKARYLQQKQRLPVRVVRAANQVNVAADRIAAYGSEILPRFESNLKMLEKAFELGEIEILDVSVAQRRFLEIQQDALNAYYEYYQASATLEQVVGAEVWPEERHDSGDE